MTKGVPANQREDRLRLRRKRSQDASRMLQGVKEPVSRAEAVSAAPRASISGNAFVYRQAPGRGPGMKKKVRGRWHPSPAQVELVIDCLTAKMPLEKAAELLGVGPRTIWIFARRIGRPFPARVGRSRGCGDGHAPPSSCHGWREPRAAGDAATLAVARLCQRPECPSPVFRNA